MPNHHPRPTEFGFCAACKRANLLGQVPATVWEKNCVVHCQPAGSGHKVLDYLGRYVFRIAITNSRLERIDNGQVTFRYRDNRSQQMRPVTLPALEFIGRFLQHVLPQGCAKVRHYGICSSSGGRQLDQARTLLKASLPAPPAQILERVRQVIRIKHYSLRTEQAYLRWIEIVFNALRKQT